MEVVDLSNRVRNIQIKFRVNNKEKKKIEEKIKESKLYKNDYLREMAMEGEVFIQDFKYLDKLIEAVDRVGRNINQIAYHANSVQAVSNRDLQIVRERVEEIWQLIKFSL
jgi:hypothetical protein